MPHVKIEDRPTHYGQPISVDPAFELVRINGRDYKNLKAYVREAPGGVIETAPSPLGPWEPAEPCTLVPEKSKSVLDGMPVVTKEDGHAVHKK